MQKTLVIVKPHAVIRGLTGEIISRFERMGMKILAIKVVHEPREFWNEFYPTDDTWFKSVGTKTLENCKAFGIDVAKRLGTDDAGKIGLMVKGWLLDHMASGSAVAMVLGGNEALTKVRTACGATLPNRAVPGTIRFELSTDSPTLANEEKRPVYNIVHASDPEEMRDGVSAFDYEIKLIFPDLT